MRALPHEQEVELALLRDKELAHRAAMREKAPWTWEARDALVAAYQGANCHQLLDRFGDPAQVTTFERTVRLIQDLADRGVELSPSVARSLKEIAATAAGDPAASRFRRRFFAPGEGGRTVAEVVPAHGLVKVYGGGREWILPASEAEALAHTLLQACTVAREL